MAVISQGLVTSRLLSEVPGLVQGFTTRALGSMAGSVYPRHEQARNRAALERAIGMVTVKPSQVHGSSILTLDEAEPGAEAGRELAAAVARSAHDGLVTSARGVALAVAVADCVPVLVVAGAVVGIAHAGWQGTSRGVVRELVARLAAEGGTLGRARAVIGPSIGPCCYVIDAARARTVRERVGAADLHPSGDGFVFDLWSANRRQLAAAGVREIEVMERCTRDEAATFFSHRGEAGRAGRGLAFVGWRS